MNDLLEALAQTWSAWRQRTPQLPSRNLGFSKGIEVGGCFWPWCHRIRSIPPRICKETVGLKWLPDLPRGWRGMGAAEGNRLSLPGWYRQRFSLPPRTWSFELSFLLPVSLCSPSSSKLTRQIVNGPPAILLHQVVHEEQERLISRLVHFGDFLAYLKIIQFVLLLPVT